MSYLRMLTAVAAVSAGAACLAAAGAQGAHISKSRAEQIAIKACGGGTVAKEQMGTRGTESVYAVDVNVKGKGFQELVNVDPSTGRVLDVTYAGQRT